MLKKTFRKKIKSWHITIFLLVIFFLQVCFLYWWIHNNPKPSAELPNLQPLIVKCKKESNWRDCYANYLAYLNQRNTLTYTLQVMREIQKKDIRTRDCHILAHKISTTELAKNPQDWEGVLKRIPYNECNYGFIHGVIEGRSKYDQSFYLNEKTLPEICKIIVKLQYSPGSDQTCAHILGHILLANQSGDVRLATNICDKVPENLQEQCNSGVFMESFTRDNIVSHGAGTYIPWNQELVTRQEALCRSYTGYSATGCWIEISHLYNYLYPDNPQKVYELCMQAPQVRDAYACYKHAVATLVTKQDANSKYYQSLCSFYEGSIREFSLCVHVAVNALLNASVDFTDQAIAYCNSVSNNFNATCFRYIGEMLQQRVSKLEQEKLCKKAPEKWRNDCKKI